MKTAASFPDDVFNDADRLARKLGHSWSQLYTRALPEFVARHDPSSVTALRDAIVAEEQADDVLLARAGWGRIMGSLGPVAIVRGRHPPADGKGVRAREPSEQREPRALSRPNGYPPRRPCDVRRS
jgi:hypothetical protein